ncbi:hypothetical protein [Azospirillum melinis]
MVVRAAGPAGRRFACRQMERLEQDETVFGRCSTVPFACRTAMSVRALLRRPSALWFARRVRIASSMAGRGVLSTVSQRTPHRFPEKTQGIQ